MAEKINATEAARRFSDLDTARVYDQIWADLRASGHNLGAHDLQIAATALHHGLTVLTANLRDFDRIPGQAVQRW